jgi:hypothetical protein
MRPRVRVLALHVVVLLSCGCGTGDAGGQDAPAASPPDLARSRGLDHALLASEGTRPDSNRASHAALATTVEEASERWRHFRMPGTPPELDFSEDAMLFLAGGESTGCPIEPTGLEIDHQASAVVARVRAREGECPSEDRPRTLVYRVRTADLPPMPFDAGIEGHRMLPVSAP